MELDRVDASGRRWRRFCTCGQEFLVNMSVLEPYLQVLSHGGQVLVQVQPGLLSVWWAVGGA